MCVCVCACVCVVAFFYRMTIQRGSAGSIDNRDGTRFNDIGHFRSNIRAPLFVSSAFSVSGSKCSCGVLPADGEPRFFCSIRNDSQSGWSGTLV